MTLEHLQDACADFESALLRLLDIVHEFGGVGFTTDDILDFAVHHDLTTNTTVFINEFFINFDE